MMRDVKIVIAVDRLPLPTHLFFIFYWNLLHRESILDLKLQPNHLTSSHALLIRRRTSLVLLLMNLHKSILGHGKSWPRFRKVSIMLKPCSQCRHLFAHRPHNWPLATLQPQIEAASEHWRSFGHRLIQPWRTLP